MTDRETVETGVSEFTDFNFHVHKVKHSIIYTEKEKSELEEKIVEDLCRVFTHKTNTK